MAPLQLFLLRYDFYYCLYTSTNFVTNLTSPPLKRNRLINRSINKEELFNYVNFHQSSRKQNHMKTIFIGGGGGIKHSTNWEIICYSLTLLCVYYYYSLSAPPKFTNSHVLVRATILNTGGFLKVRLFFY